MPATDLIVPQPAPAATTQTNEPLDTFDEPYFDSPVLAGGGE